MCIRDSFSGESAAAVTGISAVGVDYNFPAGQSAVAVRSADYETSRGIDKELRILIHHFLRQNYVKYIFFNIFVYLFLRCV